MNDTVNINYTIDCIIKNNIDTTAYGFIYMTTNVVNNKKYIGKKKFDNRWKEYLGSGVLLRKALLKYGKENFNRIIISCANTEEELNQQEIFYIDKYNAVNNSCFYNIASGGQGGFAQFAGKSEEELQLWKQRMSNSRKGRVITEEWMKKILETREKKGIGKGEKNGMYGRAGKNSPVAKPIFMLSMEDGSIIKDFECVRGANDYFNKDRAFSLISRVCVEKRGSAYGYKWLFKEDYEYLVKNNEFEAWFGQKIRKFNKHEIRGKEVYRLNLGDLKVVDKYNSISEASDKTDILSSSISRCCRHGCNTAGGYSWIFVDEYNKLDKQEVHKLYAHKSKPIPKEAHFKKSVICLNTEEPFDSVKLASEEYSIDASRISACCKGKRKSAGKHKETGEALRWVYKSDYEEMIKDNIGQAV